MSKLFILLSSRYLETSDVSGDDQPLEANFLTVADLIGPVVGLNVALFRHVSSVRGRAAAVTEESANVAQ